MAPRPGYVRARIIRQRDKRPAVEFLKPAPGNKLWRANDRFVFHVDLPRNLKPGSYLVKVAACRDARQCKRALHERDLAPPLDIE